MTPANLKSARQALGKSMQGLAEDLGYSGKHAWKNIQLMENGTRPIPERLGGEIGTLLFYKEADILRVKALFEPTGATDSETVTIKPVMWCPD